MTYDPRFRNAAFAAAVLGMLCLALGEMNLVYLALISVISPAAWFLERRGTRPTLPGFVVNLIVLAATAFGVFDYLFLSESWILSLAHFLLLVQMAKLLMPKADRDYAHIYLISLMNVAVAAVATVNLVFAFAFLLYSGIVVWGLILFHFHREAHAASTIYVSEDGKSTLRPTPALDLKPVMTRAFGWTMVAVVAAIWLFNGVFFVLSPRAHAGLLNLNPLGFFNSLTGYSDTVSLGENARVEQNRTPVMHVRLTDRSGSVLSGDRPLYWRGSTYQFYDGSRWSRMSEELDLIRPAREEGLPYVTIRRATRSPDNAITQEVVLEPIGTRTLFMLPGVVALNSSAFARVEKNYLDDTFQTREAPRQVARYTSRSVMRGESQLVPSHSLGIARDIWPVVRTAYLQLPDRVSPRVRELAGQIAPGSNSPWQRAEKIESYLRDPKNFSYTLDLKSSPGVEPVEDFLFNQKRGHCEYFASSMVVLLRCVEVPARLVGGFHGGEWSEVGQWYIVRQSDAHAWVEAYFDDRGWVRFDPTPGGGSDASRAGRLGWFSQWMDYVRTSWLNHVVQYDETEQSAILDGTRQMTDGLRQNLNSVFAAIAKFARGVFSVLTDVKKLASPEGALTVVGAFVVSTVFVLTMRWLLIRLARHLMLAMEARRARRLGRASVEFYQDLQRALKRRGFLRAPSATPREFAEAVGEELKGIERELRELTEAFYRVRFGGGRLDPDEERRLRRIVETVKTAKAG